MSVFDALPMVPTDRVNDPTDPDGIPHVTHQGVFRIGEMSLRCYQLSDGHRVIDAQDVHEFFGEAWIGMPDDIIEADDARTVEIPK